MHFKAQISWDKENKEVNIYYSFIIKILHFKSICSCTSIV